MTNLPPPLPGGAPGPGRPSESGAPDSASGGPGWTPPTAAFPSAGGPAGPPVYGGPGYPPPLGQRRSAGLVILLTVVTCFVWAAVWAYQTGGELKRWSGDGLGDVGHLLLTLFASPVTMFLLAGEVEQLYRRDGREPPITTLWGLWFLLPGIGHLIWYLQIQSAINAYWTAHGQTNKPGL